MIRLTLVGLLALGGCGTRFVELTLPDAGRNGGTNGGTNQADADPNLKCESVKRGDGTECKICYGADGTVVNGACVPIPGVPAATTPPDPGAIMCKVMPLGDSSRCLICATSPPKDYTVCLKCEAPVRTGANGESCRACMWSDLADRCLQCFDAMGTVTHDDCDSFRKEMFPKNIVPPMK